MSTTQENDSAREEQPLHPQEKARLEQVAAFPFVALTIQTTGIHPSTGKILTIDALTYNAAGEVGQEFHAVLNPDSDPGPKHQHGLSPAEIAGGQKFMRVLKPLDRLLDDRRLVIHDTSYTWGFITFEARRAMTAAARANRSRQRGKNRRKRQKVGHIPKPVVIIDTLATARRRGIKLADVRLAAVAAASGVAAPDYRANLERARKPEAETSREATALLLSLERAQAHSEGMMASFTPEDLRADRFGLQRTHTRVDATQAPRIHRNPGVFTGVLRRGMEFVVAPEIAMDPDEVIAAAVAAGLNYVEKLTRESSLLVCNLGPEDELRGKAMQAARKNIPLISDAHFMKLLENVAEALPGEPTASRSHFVPNANNRSARGPQPSGQEKSSRQRRSRSRNRRRRGKGSTQ